MGDTQIVYVGSGRWGAEVGKIEVFELDVPSGSLRSKQELEAGGIAAFMVRSPDGRTLYVADEGRACVTSHAIAAGTGLLSEKNRVECAGHPVYVALDGAGAALVTCFFGEGKTQVFAIESDGSLGEPTCLVDSGRESHCTVFDPAHRYVFVPTRGDHWIAQYRYDASARRVAPNTPALVHEEKGAGPRHLAFHPNGRFAYLVNELALTVSVYGLDAATGTLEPVQRGVPSAMPGGASGSGAHVHVHPSGRYLYVSNRQGDDSNLAVFEIEASSGRLRVLGHEPTRGRTPRHFNLDAAARVLIVGNQDSNEVALFRVQDGGARLGYVRSYPVAPGPFFIGIY